MSWNWLTSDPATVRLKWYLSHSRLHIPLELCYILAQIGALVSHRVPGRMLLNLLAIALALVAVRLLIVAATG